MYNEWATRVLRWAAACGVIVGCVACAADADGGGGFGGGSAGSGGNGGAGGFAGTAGTGGSGGNATDCVPFDTQPCNCVDGSAGRRQCSTASVWSLCDCGTTGGAGAAGGGGSLDPSLEPPGNRRQDIMFEWENTAVSNCEAGRYEGSFMCEYTGGGSATPILVTGPIVMTLTKSPSGEFLEITDGRLDGAALLLIGFSSALSGRLNCSTREFTARAEDGLWGPGLVLINPFDGELTAQYDDLTSTLNGLWLLNEMTTMGVCEGPWNARRVGP